MERNPTKPMDLFELADALAAARDRYSELKEQLSETNAQIEDLERILSERMLDEETTNFARHGRKFVVKETVRASAVPGQKEQLFDALRSNGYGDLIYETVNANTFSAHVKGEIEARQGELPEYLEGLVNVFKKTTVAISNAR